MPRPHARLSVLATAFLLTACGAGEPQKEETTDLAEPAGYIVSTTSAEARRYFADGNREWDFYRSAEAYANFEHAIAADPDFALAHLSAAATAPSTDLSVAHLGHARALAPKVSEYERLMIEGIDANQRGDNEAATRLVAELTSKYPTNFQAWIYASVIDATAGRIPERRAALQKAIDVAPDQVLGYVLLAESFTLQAPYDLTRAEELLRKSIELEPNEGNPHDLLGDVFRARGQLEESAAEYTMAAELDPTSGGPLQQRGHVNTFLGRYAEARADYDASVELEKGNARALFAAYRAFAHLYEDNPQGAIDELEALYANIDGLNVPDPETGRLFVLDQIKAISGHHGFTDVQEQAVQRAKQLRDARVARVNDPELRRNSEMENVLDAGFLAARRGNFAEASRLAGEYTRLRENDRRANKNWPAHNLLGTIALQQGEHAEALKHLEQADPDEHMVWYKRAVAHEALGQTAEAKALYRKLSTTYFNSVSIALVRNEALAKVAALN